MVKPPREQEEPQEENKPKEEVKLVDVTATTKEAFELPNGDIVEASGLLVWMANLVFKMSKNLT